jgi:hypothetical protein
MSVIIWMIFKGQRGFYFYSMLVSSWGIIIYALATIIKFYQVWMNDYVSVTYITIGRYAVVMSQSIVQLSRLNLVVHDRYKIRRVFCMIVVTALLFHVPTAVMTYGASVEDDGDSGCGQSGGSVNGVENIGGSDEIAALWHGQVGPTWEQLN